MRTELRAWLDEILRIADEIDGQRDWLVYYQNEKDRKRIADRILTINDQVLELGRAVNEYVQEAIKK